MREQSFSFADQRVLKTLFTPTAPAVSPGFKRESGEYLSTDRPKAPERVMRLLSPFDFEWNKFMAYMGPGAMVSIAYIDPGNIDIDIQAGAQFAYSLVWFLPFSVVIKNQHKMKNFKIEKNKNVLTILKIKKYKINLKNCKDQKCN